MAGRPNVVRDTADYIVNETWFENRRVKAGDEDERIIATAARLVLGNIRAAEFEYSNYLTNDVIGNSDAGKEWLPPYLRLFLEKVIKNPLHQATVGQCIVNVTSLCSALDPIPFGLGVEMDHSFGSKWLINKLNALGFSVSYDNVVRYKQSVTENEDIKNMLQECILGKFTQWMADNVDHNPATLDGKGSLHAMGICSATVQWKGFVQNFATCKTPETKVSLSGDTQ